MSTALFYNMFPTTFYVSKASVVKDANNVVQYAKVDYVKDAANNSAIVKFSNINYSPTAMYVFKSASADATHHFIIETAAMSGADMNNAGLYIVFPVKHDSTKTATLFSTLYAGFSSASNKPISFDLNAFMKETKAEKGAYHTGSWPTVFMPVVQTKLFDSADGITWPATAYAPSAKLTAINMSKENTTECVLSPANFTQKINCRRSTDKASGTTKVVKEAQPFSVYMNHMFIVASFVLLIQSIMGLLYCNIVPPMTQMFGDNRSAVHYLWFCSILTTGFILMGQSVSSDAGYVQLIWGVGLIALAVVSHMRFNILRLTSTDCDLKNVKAFDIWEILDTSNIVVTATRLLITVLSFVLFILAFTKPAPEGAYIGANLGGYVILAIVSVMFSK